MKKRTITLMLSLLAVMLLVGVGFATWVISQGAEATGQGNIIVEEVHDDRLVVSPATITDGDEIVFGALTSSTSGWLHSDNQIGGETKPEHLVVTLEYTVTKKGNGEFASNTAVQAVVERTSADLGNTALVSEASTAVSYAWADGSGTDKTAIKVTVTVTYAWGSLFGGANPYNYFNAAGIHADDKLSSSLATSVNTALSVDTFDTDSTYADMAVAVLEAIETLTSGKTYAFKVTFAIA